MSTFIGAQFSLFLSLISSMGLLISGYQNFVHNYSMVKRLYGEINQEGQDVRGLLKGTVVDSEDVAKNAFKTSID